MRPRPMLSHPRRPILNRRQKVSARAIAIVGVANLLAVLVVTMTIGLGATFIVAMGVLGVAMLAVICVTQRKSGTEP